MYSCRDIFYFLYHTYKLITADSSHFSISKNSGIMEKSKRNIHQSDSALTAQIWKDWVETSVYANHNKEANIVIYKKYLVEWRRILEDKRN